MLAALESMRGEFEPGFVIDVIDVDSDPALLVLYDELVPVLLVSLDDSGEQLRELCHYFLDPVAVRDCLANFGRPAPLNEKPTPMS